VGLFQVERVSGGSYRGSFAQMYVGHCRDIPVRYIYVGQTDQSRYGSHHIWDCPVNVEAGEGGGGGGVKHTRV
jgi:hypothetical protein